MLDKKGKTFPNLACNPLIRFIIIFLFFHHEINVYFDPEVKSIIPGLFTL